MRPLIANTFLTLDGVMQAPGGPEEDPSGGFALGGWSVTHWDPFMDGVMDEVAGSEFDLLLGRKTYQIFAAHWPAVGDGDPMAAALNRATKYVASDTIREPAWAPTIVLSGDVPGAVARLKQEDGPALQVHGSWRLLQTLQRYGLVDEYLLMTFPVVAGGGKRLFADSTPPSGLELLSLETSPKGVVAARYRRRGPVEVGSFALDEPTPAELRRRARQDA